MDFFDLDDIASAAEKIAKKTNVAERYMKGLKKEHEKPKKAFSYYKELYRPPPASMKGKLGGRKVSPKLAYGALATLGMVRCSVLAGKLSEARDYATTLTCYPDPAIQKSGEAALRYLDGDIAGAQQTLLAARQTPSFSGDTRAHYLGALDRCPQLFHRPAREHSSQETFREPKKDWEKKKREKQRRSDSPTRPLARQAPTQEIHHHHVVVQNIGEYVAGGRVDIRESVVQRSQLGNTTGGDHPHDPSFDPDVNMPSRPRFLEEYRKLLESVWGDGIVTDQEFEFLQRIRKHERITMSEHLQVEMEVREKMMGSTESYPCPACGSSLQYAEEYDNWYCWDCEEYKY